MTDQATLELWAGLGRVLLEQAKLTTDRVERQLALEMAGMAADFANRRCDETLRDLLDGRAAA